MSRDQKKTVTLDPEDNAAQEMLRRIKEGQNVLGHVAMPTDMPRFDQMDHTRPKKGNADVLTPEQMQQLAKQGQLIPGVGSAYAANQPASKEKDKAPTKPAPPREPKEGELSPETVKLLHAAQEETKKPPEKSEDDDVKALSDSLGKEAADFEEDEFGNRVRTLINNRERRKKIEERCSEINLEDLIVHMELRQTVQIVPDVFYPTYRSPGGREDLWVKQQMFLEEGKGGDVYIVDKFSMFNLTLGLYALNGKPLPSHLDKNGDIDLDSFNTKYNAIMRFPVQILADLSVNYVWFHDRVQRLTIVDQIKGF